MLRTYPLLDCFADVLHGPTASNKAPLFPINRILPSSFKYPFDRCLGSARERECASPWIMGWQGFDSFGALLTPGRCHLCQFIRDKSSTILSTKRPTVTSSIRRYLFSSSVRRSINAVSCLALSRNRLETALHDVEEQAVLVFNCDCCDQQLVHLKFLVGMLG